MKLNFINYRHFKSIDGMSPLERKQYFGGSRYQRVIAASAEEIDAYLVSIFSEGISIEFVDVADDQGKVTYQWLTDTSGGASLHSDNTTDLIAKACQHSLEHCRTKALWFALADAQSRCENIRNKIDFTIDDDCEHRFIAEDNESER